MSTRTSNNKNNRGGGGGSGGDVTMTTATICRSDIMLSWVSIHTFITLLRIIMQVLSDPGVGVSMWVVVMLWSVC